MELLDETLNQRQQCARLVERQIRVGKTARHALEEFEVRGCERRAGHWDNPCSKTKKIAEIPWCLW